MARARSFPLALVSLAAALALAACGGSDGGSGGGTIPVTPAPSPSSSPSPSPSSSPSPSPSSSPSPTPSPSQNLTGDISPVHDPAIIHAGAYYYVYSTSQVGEAPGLIPIRRSSDLVAWQQVGAVYQAIPDWAKTRVPGTSGIWAPSVFFKNGEYRLYYAVSTFGSNVSAIGLTTSPTLDPADPAYKWTDQGIVFGSQASDNFNTIDPSIIDDAGGREWMVFGSFFSGIKLIELDPATGKPKEATPTLHTLAERAFPDAIEAPVLVAHGGYYYLFASYDYCCQGANSSYYTVVGRSTAITGPYVDKQGQPMTQGFAETILTAASDPSGRYVGPGSVSVMIDGANTFIAYHAYDVQRSGAPTLRIRPIDWGADGWPVVG